MLALKLEDLVQVPTDKQNIAFLEGIIFLQALDALTTNKLSHPYPSIRQRSLRQHLPHEVGFRPDLHLRDVFFNILRRERGRDGRACRQQTV